MPCRQRTVPSIDGTVPGGTTYRPARPGGPQRTPIGVRKPAPPCRGAADRRHRNAAGRLAGGMQGRPLASLVASRRGCRHAPPHLAAAGGSRTLRTLHARTLLTPHAAHSTPCTRMPEIPAQRRQQAPPAPGLSKWNDSGPKDRRVRRPSGVRFPHPERTVRPYKHWRPQAVRPQGIASGLISPPKRPRAGWPLVEPSIRIQNDFTAGSIMVNTGG